MTEKSKDVFYYLSIIQYKGLSLLRAVFFYIIVVINKYT